jgi:hypothetical protein
MIVSSDTNYYRLQQIKGQWIGVTCLHDTYPQRFRSFNPPPAILPQIEFKLNHEQGDQNNSHPVYDGFSISLTNE